MAHTCTLIRDEIYLRIAVKKAANEFIFANDFVIEKTWKPFEYLEDLADPAKFPHGKVYIMAARPGDIMNRSRQPNKLCGPRDHVVQLGFQVIPRSIQDDDEMDSYISFMQELEQVCINEVDLEPFSFSRIEYLLDPEGMPLSYIMNRRAQTFESYFSAFYTAPVSN